MNTSVGFLGVGRMGAAMAGQLVDAGHDVRVWGRSPGSTDALVERGARPAATPEEAIATGTVFSMLAHEDAYREVFTEERVAAAPSPTVFVNHATISEDAATEFATLARRHGHDYVAAPVLGRADVADAGQLTVLASGTPETVAAVRPVLEVIGKRVWDFGSTPSSANRIKIAVNYLLLHAIQAISESVVLVEQAGLDTATFVDAINDSVFPGPVYRGYGDAIAQASYLPPGFTTVLGLKDLMLALGAAERSGVHLSTADGLRDVYETAVSEVGEDLDWAAVAEVTRRRSAPA